MESKLFLEVYEYGPDFDIASTLSEIHHQICQGEWDGLIWVRNATEKSPSGYFLKDHCYTYLNLVYFGSWIWLSRLQRFLVSWIVGVVYKETINKNPCNFLQSHIMHTASLMYTQSFRTSLRLQCALQWLHRHFRWIEWTSRVLSLLATSNAVAECNSYFVTAVEVWSCILMQIMKQILIGNN